MELSVLHAVRQVTAGYTKTIATGGKLVVDPDSAASVVWKAKRLQRVLTTSPPVVNVGHVLGGSGGGPLYTLPPVKTFNDYLEEKNDYNGLPDIITVNDSEDEEPVNKFVLPDEFENGDEEEVQF